MKTMNCCKSTNFQKQLGFTSTLMSQGFNFYQLVILTLLHICGTLQRSPRDAQERLGTTSGPSHDAAEPPRDPQALVRDHTQLLRARPPSASRQHEQPSWPISREWPRRGSRSVQIYIYIYIYMYIYVCVWGRY